MNVDITELIAAMIVEAGGTIVINAETLSNGFGNQIIAIDPDYKKDILVLSLVDADDVDYGDEIAE